MGQQVVPGEISQEGASEALSTLVGGAPLSGAKVHLFQSSFNPTPTNVAADFLAAEANFTGYGPVALTYSAIGYDANGIPTVLTTRAFFQASDSASPNTVGGCWVQYDTTGPPATHTSVEYYTFPVPIPMNTALAFLGVVIGVQQPNGAGYAIVDN